MEPNLDPQFFQVSEEYKKARDAFGICETHERGPLIFQCIKCPKNRENPVPACLLCVDDETSHHGHNLKLVHTLNVKEFRDHVRTMKDLIDGKLIPEFEKSEDLKLLVGKWKTLIAELRSLELDVGRMMPPEREPFIVDSIVLLKNLEAWKEKYDELARGVRKNSKIIQIAETAIENCENPTVVGENLAPEQTSKDPADVVEKRENSFDDDLS